MKAESKLWKRLIEIPVMVLPNSAIGSVNLNKCWCHRTVLWLCVQELPSRQCRSVFPWSTPNFPARRESHFLQNMEAFTSARSSPQWWSARPHMMCSICGRWFATPPFGVRGSWGWAHSIARPQVPTSSPLTHIVYLLLFSSYLAGSKNVSAHPTDPDTMTNTTLEATTSSSGNKVSTLILEAHSVSYRVFCSIRCTLISCLKGSPCRLICIFFATQQSECFWSVDCHRT